MPSRPVSRITGAQLPVSLSRTKPPCRALHALGQLPAPGTPSVAIVGSRTPGASGEHMAYEIAWAVARAGVCVVSGMARGIDSAAHRGALDAAGLTVGVLGSGLEAIGTRTARELALRIGERGAVLSEYAAGMAARPYTFVERNRIIAALAPVTLVVEAGARSGALITAGFALDLGHVVAAVPGDPRRPTCRGSNRLIRDGAPVITEAADLLALLGLAAAPGAEAPEPPGLDPAERKVWRALAQRGPSSAEPLSRHAGLTASALLGALSRLELAGHVHREGERFALSRPGRGG